MCFGPASDFFKLRKCFYMFNDFCLTYTNAEAISVSYVLSPKQITEFLSPFVYVW